MMRGLTFYVILSLWINTLVVEAGIFLKAKDPHIVQEAIWLYSNSTAITQIATDVHPQKFYKSIAPLDNVPDASADGTVGVLYNRDDSCSPDTIQQPIPYAFYTPTPKQSKVPKIALIKKQGGNCTLVQKIKNAESEGAIGVIVYDTNEVESATEQDRKSGVPPDNGITIPAYYVNYTIGADLYFQLGKMAGVPTHVMPTFDNSNLTTRIAVRVAIMSADNIKPTAWELTLLVMLVLLGTSIFFSVIMQVFMWQRNKRLQGVVDRHRVSVNEGVLPMGKAVLSITRLYQFPTRTIDTLPDEEERKKVEDVLSDEKQREALMKSTALTPTPVEPVKPSRGIFGKKKPQVVKKPSVPNVALKFDAPLNSMCVICLEAFKMSDEVRELPCHHEYHTMCIDPWLTTKSAECPLCKYDCSEIKSEGTTVMDGDATEESVGGIRGFLMKPYFRYKANKRKRVGQVGVSYNPERSASQAQVAPASPGLRAALRAVEAVDNAPEPTNMNSVQANPAPEAEHQPSPVETVSLDPTPRQSTASEMTATNHSQLDPSHALDRDETDTLRTATNYSIISAYNQDAASTLPDIDVSSISLCSIDLGGLSEDFHNTLDNNNSSNSK